MEEVTFRQASQVEREWLKLTGCCLRLGWSLALVQTVVDQHNIKQHHMCSTMSSAGAQNVLLAAFKRFHAKAWEGRADSCLLN